MASPPEPGAAPGPPRRGPAEPPRLVLIVAVARNGSIGLRNALPWRLPEDLRRFRALTTGHTIVMGRRTWQSLDRPLPDRQNIVVTRDAAFGAAGADVAHSLDEALALARLPDPVFCIGGAQLFRDALPKAEVVHLTEIDGDFPGDTFWTPLDRTEWREIAREAYPPKDDRFGYAFVTLLRVPAAACAD